jgi:hypothetical protein
VLEVSKLLEVYELVVTVDNEPVKVDELVMVDMALE